MKRRKFPRVNTTSSSSSGGAGAGGSGAFEMQTFRMDEDSSDRREEEPIAGPSNYQEGEQSTRHRSHTVPDNERERDITLPLPNTTPRRSPNPTNNNTSNPLLPTSHSRPSHSHSQNPPNNNTTAHSSSSLSSSCSSTDGGSLRGCSFLAKARESCGVACDGGKGIDEFRWGYVGEEGDVEERFEDDEMF